MSSSKVEALFKSFWDWRMLEFPEFATFCGVHDYDGKLQSYTLESIENRKIVVEKYLEEASQLISEANLTEKDNLNLEFFISDMTSFLTGAAHKGYFFPLTYLDGVHIEFDRLLGYMKCKTEADFLKIVERLTNLPRQISEIIQIMKEGIKQKMTVHSISIHGVLEQLSLLQKKPEESIFFKPFLSITEDTEFTLNSKEELLTKAKKIIAENVLPSFDALKRFLEKDYLKHLRPEIAISSLDGGKEYYQAVLNFHLTCSMTPEEVHKIGLEEVARISKKIEKVIETLELKMSLKEFSDHMRKESAFCFSNVEEMLDAYKGALFNQIEPQLPKLFNYLPKLKLVVKSYPETALNAPRAYYYAGTSDGGIPGTFLINTSDLKALPKYRVMTIALHEGMPGHHFQSSFLIEDEDIPEFRKLLEDRRTSEAPCLFPGYTAYIEGWGLYSEYLGYELGLYDDVYLEYGHLSDEMMRACRLVVDTGIHILGWSRDQAIEFMLNHMPKPRSEIESEIDRYITWPAQACAYKIGELKIKALREQAEKALGSKFDIRKFHDVVLQSFGPLHVLEEKVAAYISDSSDK